MNYFEEKIEITSIMPAQIYIGNSNISSNHYPLHWHKDLEFNLVLEGTLKTRINSKITDIPRGKLCFVNSGELHETEVEADTIMSNITLLLSYSLIKEYCPDIDAYYFDFSEKPAIEDNIKELILQCADLFQKKTKFYELEISIALRQICFILLKECRKKRENIEYGIHEQTAIMNVKKAISYMEQNYKNHISLKHIADEIGMTPTYFSRFFKNATGENYYFYLNKIRLFYAHKELVSSDLSVTEIAFDNGFSNVKSFIEFFKKLYSTTPEKYRKVKKQKA